MWKAYIQVGGAVLSAVYTGYSLVEDTGIALIGLFFFVVFVGWILYDKQTEINNLRGDTRIAASSKYLPVACVRPDTWSMYAVIDFEVWTSVDLHTCDLVLNVVCVSLPGRWWKFWESLRHFPFHHRAVGIRAAGSPYRKNIKCSDPQPFRDTVVFQYTGDRAEISRATTCMLPELVLETAIPRKKTRVFLDRCLYDKGAITPL